MRRPCLRRWTELLADRELANPHIGRLPLATAIDQFYTADVFMHTWDLSRATGQDDRLDPDFCAQLLGGMEQMEEVLRSSGQFGVRVEVPEITHGGPVRVVGVLGRGRLLRIAEVAPEDVATAADHLTVIGQLHLAPGDRRTDGAGAHQEGLPGHRAR